MTVTLTDAMGNVVTMQTQDLDGDGILNYVDFPLYYLSVDCMPSAGLDNQGNIFVSYSSLMENIDNGSQNFRHVNVVKSMDGGTTWSTPKDVTEWTDWGGAQECVFARMDENVDDKIRLIYQKDFEPGLAVRGDEDIIEALIKRGAKSAEELKVEGK